MSNFIATVAFFAVLAVCAAQAFVLDTAAFDDKLQSLSKCLAPKIKTMPDFKLSQYKGIWYEHYKIPIITEVLMKCCQTNVTYDDTTGHCNMTDKGYRFGKYQSGGTEIVTQPEAVAPGKLSTKFLFPLSPVGNYWILDTDYTSYAVVYSCVDLKIFSADYAWILTRTQGVPDSNAIAKAQSVLTANGIDIKKLKPTDQTTCPPLSSDQ